MTWNLLWEPRLVTERMELARQAVMASAPDVLAVQEVLHDVGELGGLSSAEHLANLTGLTLAAQGPGTLTPQGSGENCVTSTAVLSRLPVLHTLQFPMTEVRIDENDLDVYAGAVLQQRSGRPLLVVSAHLPWGGHREQVRQAYAAHLVAQIEAVLSELPKDTVTVLAGDFNALADSSTLRWFTGLEPANGAGTFWVDAWVQGEGPGDGATSVPSTHPVLSTGAQVNGITNPLRIPSRRIDYILVRGWVYGRAGDPYDARLVGTHVAEDGLSASDHFGVQVELADPAA